MNRTKCPACEKIQTLRTKENKIDVTCKKCKIIFSAERMGDKYKEVKKRGKNSTTVQTSR